MPQRGAERIGKTLYEKIWDSHVVKSLDDDRAILFVDRYMLHEGVHKESFGLYGSRKVWHQMRREGIKMAKCTVERLMRTMGLAGVQRGKSCVTTISNPKTPCPLDKVNREFKIARPNALWVVDFTYIHTWAGFAYVAFVIDAFARRIVGWKVGTTASADFVLDALERAIHARRPGPENKLIHHCDRGSQYPTVNYTQRLAEADLVPSVGSVGDSARQDHQRPLQGQGHLATAVLAKRLGRRNGDPALGRLVQQSPPLRTYRSHPAGRSRGKQL